MSAHRNRSKLVGLVCGGALVLGACTSGSSSGTDDKAGGDADPTVLTLADSSFALDSVPAVKDFVGRVEELSGGALRFDVRSDWGDYDVGAEQQLVRDVADGTVD